MMIYYISDTHFNHTNIIKYANRPFSSVDEMNDIMVQNWNNAIKPNDVVIHGGDVAMKNSKFDINMIRNLNGYKILVKGNHDYSKKTMNGWGFNEIYTSFYDKKSGIFVNHRPLINENDSYRVGLYTQCKIFLYGHIHEKIMENLQKSKNICVEHTNYTPISQDEILDNLKNLI